MFLSPLKDYFMHVSTGILLGYAYILFINLNLLCFIQKSFLLLLFLFYTYPELMILEVTGHFSNRNLLTLPLNAVKL